MNRKSGRIIFSLLIVETRSWIEDTICHENPSLNVIAYFDIVDKSLHHLDEFSTRISWDSSTSFPQIKYNPNKIQQVLLLIIIHMTIL